ARGRHCRLRVRSPKLHCASRSRRCSGARTSATAAAKTGTEAHARLRPGMGRDCFLAFAWQGAAEERLLVTVNYAPNQSQCYVRLPFADLANSQWRLQDQIGSASYDRDGNALQARGLYLDEPPWKACVLSLTRDG